MTVVTPDDAYALALIARNPERNRDLVDDLSPAARPIGSALVAPADSGDPEVIETARRLTAWAKGKKQ